MDKNLPIPTKICYIVGAGENSGICFSPAEDDLVIAADGGYQYLLSAGIRTDIVVGDFDSLGAPPEHPHVVRLKQEKDETDMGAAIQLGVQKGYQKYIIYGGTGGRMEHTLANIQLLNGLANQHCRGELVGNGQRYTVIKNDALELPAHLQGKISVFTLGQMAVGVNLRGLKYPLTDYLMTNTYPIGVSNEFVGEKANISVKEGELLIIYDII